MLSKEDNDLMCRVGPGTPMGNLMREYWIPALPSSEFPSPDSAPKRMRLLGENLVMFRDTKGDVGCFAQACPHRGASLFFGRNEEAGLRCVYHGWKFDVTGQCVDMPSEPPESNFKAKIRATAYPSVERGGIVWIYMGPPEKQPAPPDYEHSWWWTIQPGRQESEPPPPPLPSTRPAVPYVELIPGTWRQTRNKDNDYLIDRDMQRDVNFTGLPGNRTQDAAVTESMGTIYDRGREHLGTSDTAIIFMRRYLLRLARDL